MGVTNLDALAVSSLTIGGSPSAASGKVGSGTTPAAGWTAAGSNNYSYKDVTVTGALAGDIVIATLNAAQFVGAAPATQKTVAGYVTGSDTVRLFYTENAGGVIGSATTLAGTVSYAVFRP